MFLKRAGNATHAGRFPQATQGPAAIGSPIPGNWFPQPPSKASKDAGGSLAAVKHSGLHSFSLSSFARGTCCHFLPSKAAPGMYGWVTVAAAARAEMLPGVVVKTSASARRRAPSSRCVQRVSVVRDGPWR